MDKSVTMTENRLAIRRAFLDGKINAVCGYPGIGKTYLTMIHPIFIDGFFSKQYYTDKKKGIVNPDFPENYARFCAEAMERGQIVVCAMHPKAREVFDSLGMPYLMIYPNENERDRYFTIYDTRPDEREWIELNKSTWDTKIDSIRNAKIPTHCFKDEIPTGLNLTEYLEGLNIFDPEDLLNTLLRKIAVEPVPKEVQWWEAQGRFENLIEAHRRTCEHFNTTLLGDGQTCCTADLRALPTWQDPGGDGMVYPCVDDCPFMKQFINEYKDEDIETNHSDGRA